MTNANPYPLAAAKLSDLAIELLNARLSTLPWLDTAYGVVQRLTKEKNGVYNYPAIYVGTHQSEYLDLLPDETLITSGGYSFWDANEPITAENWRQPVGYHSFTASLVVWCDLRLVYPNDWQGRTYANIAQDVLNVLKQGTGTASIGENVRVYHEGASIYQRFTHREIERQHLMKPYAGVRIECDIYNTASCQ